MASTQPLLAVSCGWREISDFRLPLRLEWCLSGTILDPMSPPKTSFTDAPRSPRPAIGNPILCLIRVAIGGFAIENIPPGEWVELDSAARHRGTSRRL